MENGNGVGFHQLGKAFAVERKKLRIDSVIFSHVNVIFLWMKLSAFAEQIWVFLLKKRIFLEISAKKNDRRFFDVYF